jgi:hypothetical protein
MFVSKSLDAVGHGQGIGGPSTGRPGTDDTGATAVGPETATTDGDATTLLAVTTTGPQATRASAAVGPVIGATSLAPQ